MGAWWLPAEGPVGTATLFWERIEGGELLSEKVHGAAWQVRNGAHWLTYEEPGFGRTALAVERDRVRWLRFGEVTWQHTFASGETHQSQLGMMGRKMAVEIRTDRLEIDVSTLGGTVLVDATMTLQGEVQSIQSALRFHREDVADAEASPKGR